MKKIGIILAILIVIVVSTLFVISNFKYKKESDTAVNKAKEEFVFDYNEEIATIKVESLDDFYIITIFGEETLATYIYRDGDIWNYENHSS